MSDSEAPAQSRVVAGRYRLTRELGRGGMGVVWLADDELVSRQVAVKELRPPGMLDDDEREKFVQRALHEARSAARIHHSGAVTLYDVLPATGGDDAVYLIMELIDGPSLADVITEKGLPDADVARLGVQLLAVVEAAHAMGIVHRDIKPGNILIAPGQTLKLTDFGIAHTLGDPRLTNSGIMGTQAYLAPELFEGAPISPAADLWSVGATLFAAVEGRGPFDRDSTGSTLRAILFDDLPVPHCSPALAAAIGSLLQRDPVRRASPRQAREALARVTDQPPGGAGGLATDSRPTASLPPVGLKPPGAPSTPISPVLPVSYPVPPGPAGARPGGPRHAAPVPVPSGLRPGVPPLPGAPLAGPPRPGIGVPPPGAPRTGTAPSAPVLPAPPRAAPPGPPPGVTTFSNMPDDSARILMVAGCTVAFLVAVITWALVPGGVYAILLLAAIAYVIVFFVLRSRWCQLTMTPRGLTVRGGRKVDLVWDQITGFALVLSGSSSQLVAFVASLGGPKPVGICPLNPQKFPAEAVRTAILAHRPGIPVENQQPRPGFPLRPPPFR